MNAQNALMEIPVCPVDKVQLILRKRNSPESNFCGTWYDCPQCRYSVLFPSKELTAQLNYQRKRLKV